MGAFGDYGLWSTAVVPFCIFLSGMLLASAGIQIFIDRPDRAVKLCVGSIVFLIIPIILATSGGARISMAAMFFASVALAFYARHLDTSRDYRALKDGRYPPQRR